MSATFNSDARLVAFGTNDIHVLDLVSGKQTALTNLSSALGTNHLKALAFNSDSTQLAIADDEGNIYVWNIASDQLINRIHAGQKYAGSGLFYNSDSSRLVSFSDQAVAIFYTPTFQFPELYDTSDMFLPPIVTQVSLSSDESVLVVLLTYSSNSDANLMFLSEGFVNDLIVSGITHYTDGSTFALSSDGNLIVNGVKNELHIYQIDPQSSLMLNQPALVALQGQPSPTKLISFSPDMRHMISVSQSTGTDLSIHDDATMTVWGVCAS
ncbi:MAG: WD40 repeat domain-containing protein [Chloroflexota bacterium]